VSREDATPRPEPFPGDPPITAELVAEHGLAPEEYEKVLRLLGREPTYTELGMFSALWSEHCGYKNSKAVLRTLPTEGPRVVQGPGENAGALDAGHGWVVVFKIESHNHPSAVEPYQGAATGVGGILRDVFTMGARPIALLDSLRFGELDTPRARYLFEHVVRGIGDYGNCVGIPTVAGEVYFDPAYEGNPLVNAMCVGVVRRDRLVRARARGPGNPVFVVGSRTGRDGIHGATFASEELAEEAHESRPQVQVGDPFTEKLLLEATLELLEAGCVVAIQDMGAAGLTSSAAEMAARGGVGIELDVARVPVREPGMTPYEIMLSESQERMLVVVERGREGRVREILAKWDLQAAEIGRITDDGIVRVRAGGRLVAAVPARALVDECPVYERAGREDPAVAALRSQDPLPFATRDRTPPDRTLLALLDDPSLASKRWVYEQYDTSVGTATVLGPGPGDAAVLLLPDGRRAIAVKTDGNGRYVYLNPRRGGQIAVAEAARNVACTGAEPVGITNCLNFGNPLKPEVAYQFREAVLGMGDACRALGTPVTGGNVSFYNESPRGAVYPTPVVGMVGFIDDLERVTRAPFREPGDVVWLLGALGAELGGSEYLKRVHGAVAGEPPDPKLDEHRRLLQVLLAAIRAGWVRSAHDCSEGGIAVALAECCILDPGRRRGAWVDLRDAVDVDAPWPALLFGESQARVVVTTPPDAGPALVARARAAALPCTRIGEVRPEADGLRIAGPGPELHLALDALANAYFDAIPRRMEPQARSGRAA
jgi:phosphoribosylformylglycinamidine synthase II